MRCLPGVIAAALAAAGVVRPARAADFAPAQGIALETVATRLDHPVDVAFAPGDRRMFVVEQPGRIRIVEGGRPLPRPFLDLTDRVGWGGERGLLSIAFHPRYARNHQLFVDYTDRHGDTRIERYTVGADSSRAERSSAKLLLTIPQPYANHNGGLVAFAPDGMLWIGMGDGGSQGDPHGNGQNPQALLGKMLRIDVDHGDPYAIPRDNPFADGRGGRPEIWALGLRNPWRYAFDRESGQVYIADVGQNLWEEVDVEPVMAAGLDYGWNLMEGLHPYRREASPARSLTPPAVEYGHADGCSITGGVVYRGERVPALAGAYLFADYCGGWIRSFRFEGGRAVDLREWVAADGRPLDAGRPVSFGVDAAGEVYVASLDGRIFRIVAARP